MHWISQSIRRHSRLRRQATIFAAVLGPGSITMAADNDAGGVSACAVTGSHYGFSLSWILILRVPIAYYIQEMTRRLGAVTKRGHAEAEDPRDDLQEPLAKYHYRLLPVVDAHDHLLGVGVAARS